jgi:hypothetical protein
MRLKNSINRALGALTTNRYFDSLPLADIAAGNAGQLSRTLPASCPISTKGNSSIGIVAANGGAPLAGTPAPPRTPPPPRRLPSKRWRDLVLKVWHADPLRCPACGQPMRVIAVIDQPAVVEKILRHLGLWSSPPRAAPARTSCEDWRYEPDPAAAPMPDYESVFTA